MECDICLLTDRMSPLRQMNERWLCEECYQALTHPLDYNAMAEEFEGYVRYLKQKNQGRKYDVLFALSGGKDSIAALYFTIEKYHLRPLAFTVDHGFKNQVIWKNCENIVRHYGIDWFQLKVNQDVTQTIGKYALAGDLPCCHCNKLWKGQMVAKAIEISGISDLFIGGDTLDQHTAIIARKDYQTDTVGLPLPLNIRTEAEIYQIAESLGWVNPGTKGWDTDCIAVGVALENYRGENNCPHIEEVRHLSHRIRYGLLEKETARCMLNEPIRVEPVMRAQFDEALANGKDR